ncbi:MAG: ADOP family duplicated permease [Acidobacteriota bacterium]
MNPWRELRLALRALRRSPAFTMAAALTLVLGMGSTLAVLRLVDATLLHPLPGVADPDRLVAITSSSISRPSFDDFRAAARAELDLAGFQNRPLVMGLPGGSERLESAVVSGGFFRVLGVRASAGRLLGEDDDRPAAPAVAVLSARLAQRMGGAAAVGRVLAINGSPFEIVGVVGNEFRGVQLAQAPQAFISMYAWSAARPSSFAGLDLATRRGWSWINTFGRLRPGVDAARAEAALNVSAARQEAAYPKETRTGFRVKLSPAALAVFGVRGLKTARAFSGMLGGAALIVLLLACANVANLLLARGESRRREVATRLAVGAGRRHVVFAVLGEATVLAVAAALGGIVFVGLAARLLVNVELPGGVLLGSLDLAPDARTIVAALGLAFFATVVFGLIPALRAARQGLNAGLRSGSTGNTSRMSGLLVGVQVALGVVLLVGAGLLGRALGQALAIDTGMSTQHLALATLDVGLARYDTARAGQAYTTALEQTAATPGVESAAWALSVPLTADGNTESLTVPGYTPAPDEQPEVEVATVSAGYFSTLGISLARGRDFTTEDRVDSLPVAVVNEAFVRQYFAGREVLGAKVDLVGRSVQVIGVVRDARLHDLIGSTPPCLYDPLAQRLAVSGLDPMTLMVRTAGDPQAVLPALDRVLRAAAPGAPVYHLGTFDDLYSALLAPQRFGGALLGVFGALGLILSAVGVFSVVSYAASRRTREVGIRAALGATPRAVVGLFVGESLRRVLIGVVSGIVVAAGLARLLRGFLYGIHPLDPLTYAVTAGVLVAAAALAAFLPARRASRREPWRALRED